MQHTTDAFNAQRRELLTNDNTCGYSVGRCKPLPRSQLTLAWPVVLAPHHQRSHILQLRLRPWRLFAGSSTI